MTEKHHVRTLDSLFSWRPRAQPVDGARTCILFLIVSHLSKSSEYNLFDNLQVSALVWFPNCDIWHYATEIVVVKYVSSSKAG